MVRGRIDVRGGQDKARSNKPESTEPSSKNTLTRPSLPDIHSQDVSAAPKGRATRTYGYSHRSEGVSSFIHLPGARPLAGRFRISDPGWNMTGRLPGISVIASRGSPA